MSLERIQRTEGMKRQATELIEQAYNRGFKAGRELATDRENELIEQGMELGRNEAWECVRKIAQMPTEISEPIFNQFGLHNIMANYSASEAIENLKAWEQRQQKDDKIHVGDEVLYHEDKGIVVCEANTNTCMMMGYDGSYMISAYKHELVKTGKHYPEIVEVLKKMQEDE